MQIPKLLTYGLYVLLGLVALALIVGSAIVRFTKFIVRHPLSFVTELIFMSIITSLPVLVFIFTRRIKAKLGLQYVLLFAVKLAIIHVGCELSGFYDYAFSGTT